MLKSTESVRPDTDEVVAKVIDGEAIIMNVRSGIYYSMEGAGAFMWCAIEQGKTLEEVAAAVAEHFNIPIERATEDALRLAEKLVEEGIVIVGSAAKDSADEEPKEELFETQAYTTPQLNIYRDMGDLLALDPPAPSASDLRWKE